MYAFNLEVKHMRSIHLEIKTLTIHDYFVDTFFFCFYLRKKGVREKRYVSSCLISGIAQVMKYICIIL